MTLFHYPKAKHVRTVTPPRTFKKYQSYKKYLQVEFVRVCVYCRQPDCTAPNLNFGVDHYRPVSLFGGLICDYTNLYYCCGSCNSRKRDYWPANSKTGPHVVNPCDYAMMDYLRFDPATGEIKGKKPHGVHTIELLQLNEPASVEHRKAELTLVRTIEAEITRQTSMKKKAERLYKKNKISQDKYNQTINELNNHLIELQHILQSHTGALVTRLPGT